jgi:hypothetical protein
MVILVPSVPLSRRATYIGIRNFFHSTTRNALQTRTAGSCGGIDIQRTTRRQVKKGPTASVPNAAEAEWLQEDDLRDAALATQAENSLHFEVSTFFDWRARAPSRAQEPDKRTKPENRKAIRRNLPTAKRVTAEEPLHDAIVSYENR